MRAAVKDAEFWKLIDCIDREALARGRERAAVEPLRAALRPLKKTSLEAFHELLSKKVYALDTPVFADAAGDNGQSGDQFLYARCFVVAHGRKFFESVLANPKLMPKSISETCEPLLSVAWTTYEKETGKDWTFTASVSMESFSNPLWRDESR